MSEAMDRISRPLTESPIKSGSIGQGRRLLGERPENVVCGIAQSMPDFVGDQMELERLNPSSGVFIPIERR